jgi:hypothetical protein
MTTIKLEQSDADCADLPPAATNDSVPIPRVLHALTDASLNSTAPTISKAVHAIDTSVKAALVGARSATPSSSTSYRPNSSRPCTSGSSFIRPDSALSNPDGDEKKGTKRKRLTEGLQSLMEGSCSIRVCQDKLSQFSYLEVAMMAWKLTLSTGTNIRTMQSVINKIRSSSVHNT